MQLLQSHTHTYLWGYANVGAGSIVVVLPAGWDGTRATDSAGGGADISHVQRLLGHSNISTTARYTHLVTDDIKKAHAKFLIEV